MDERPMKKNRRKKSVCEKEKCVVGLSEEKKRREKKVKKMKFFGCLKGKKIGEKVVENVKLRKFFFFWKVI